MSILNYSCKIKKKGFVVPNVFSVIPFPSQKSCFKNYFVIAFTYKQKESGFPTMYLNYGLHLNSNYHCSGLWRSEREARKFIIDNFYE